LDLLSNALRAPRARLAMFCGVLALTGFGVFGEDHREGVQRQNVPTWVVQLFSAKKLDGQSDFVFTLNPFHLRGDFNGDDKPDVAILVRNKESGKLGIAICHGGKNEIFLVGAGTAIGNCGDDFSWMDVWQIHPKPSGEKGCAPAKLIGEALQVEKSESGGGLICWDGKKYVRQQQGD
jgi:hypothetical protein